MHMRILYSRCPLVSVKKKVSDLLDLVWFLFSDLFPLQHCTNG
jgi:hypothetical protein